MNEARHLHAAQTLPHASSLCDLSDGAQREQGTSFHLKSAHFDLFDNFYLVQTCSGFQQKENPTALQFSNAIQRERHQSIFIPTT